MPFDGTNDLTEVHLTLMAARDLIKKGWCQRGYRKLLKRGPSYCVLGAIHYATFGEPTVGYQTPVTVELVNQTKAVFASAVGICIGGCIESWNDEKGRKKSEVLAAFDRAIASVTT